MSELCLLNLNTLFYVNDLKCAAVISCVSSFNIDLVSVCVWANFQLTSVDNLQFRMSSMFTKTPCSQDVNNADGAFSATPGCESGCLFFLSGKVGSAFC